MKNSFLILTMSLALAAVPVCAGEISDKTTKEVIQPEDPRFRIYGWVEGGVTFNGDRPKDRQNFGHLFTDRANEPLFNQAVITLERALRPNRGQWDWGFKLQGMFGSDARLTHYLGTLDNTIHEIVQPDLVEAYLSLHAPLITEGGIDLKFGHWVTLEGAETIDPRTNFFYSHTYSFNFGIPFKHTGVLATIHATKWLDLHAGWTRGVNMGWDDNNDVGSFHGSFGLNFFDANWSSLPPRTSGRRMTPQCWTLTAKCGSATADS